MPQPDLFGMNWPRIGALLGAEVEVRRTRLFAGVSLLTPDGRQVLVFDNGGEWNLAVREPDGLVWSTDFSVPYVAWSLLIGPATAAYRIGCHAGDRRIDHAANLDVPGMSSLAAVAVAVALSPPNWPTSRRRSRCSCTKKAGHRVGVVCLPCQLARGPLRVGRGETRAVAVESEAR